MSGDQEQPPPQVMTFEQFFRACEQEQERVLQTLTGDVKATSIFWGAAIMCAVASLQAAGHSPIAIGRFLAATLNTNAEIIDLGAETPKEEQN